MLVDHAAGAQSQRIVAAADDDFARSCDIDRIVAITGDYGATAKDSDINLAATRDADGRAQMISPLNQNRLRAQTLSS